MALDIDLVGDSAVVYDVARERIVRDGSWFVRRELKGAVLTGLKEMGIFDKMVPETQEALTRSFEGPPSGRVASAFHMPRNLDDALLEKVARLVPSENWPQRLHAEIAEKLGISNGLAHRAIDSLLLSGRIVKP